ncbi:MAG: hypothetical protein ACRCT8_04320 [Lacipirellulaceae bacterium]
MAQLIDFEATPAGATPIDDGVLSSLTPYTAGAALVNFGFDSDSNGSIDTDAVFERAGTFSGEAPNAGFSGSSGIDTADPGFGPQLGGWFLRSPVGGSDFGQFIIEYTAGFPVTDASGEVWDIDGIPGSGGNPGVTEEYTVRAFDAASNLLATQVSPLGIDTSGTSLDGQPWTFVFTGLTAGIDRIVVDFTGTKTSGIGLAFNNFSPLSVIPEPAGALLLLMGGALFARRRLRDAP